MIILFFLFIVQFAIACSCLAVTKHQQRIFAEEGWNEVSDEIKSDVQTTFNCCGFNSTTADDHPSCDAVNKICCPLGSIAGCACLPCLPKLEDTIDSAFFVAGSIGLFFSFTEVIVKRKLPYLSSKSSLTLTLTQLTYSFSSWESFWHSDTEIRKISMHPHSCKALESTCKLYFFVSIGWWWLSGSLIFSLFYLQSFSAINSKSIFRVYKL